MEKDLDLFFNKKKKKKKLQDEKNQTLQHDQNKIVKLSNKHVVQWSEGNRFI